MKEKVMVPDKTLHDIALEAREATKGLSYLLERQRKTARRRLIVVTALYVPFAMIVGTLASVGLITTCFLGTDPNGGHPAICNAIPGYEEAQAKNRQILKQFSDLLETTQRNDRRIGRLEKANG